MKRYDTALVLGYGRSGQAAERMLQAEGTDTVVLTQETAGEAELTRILTDRSFDVCIVSPGFALTHPWLCAVREARIPLCPELELGWSRHRGRTIAVSGSNGKSTAVKWIGEAIQEAGFKAEIGGNYGIPACEVVHRHRDLDWLVLEVSSFQLETVADFHADIAVVLNVFPNHLDRHGSMDMYWRTKARIFGNSSSPGDACLVPIQWVERFAGEVGSHRKWITFGDSKSADYRFSDGQVYHGGESVMDLSGTPFNHPVFGGCTGAAAAGIAATSDIPVQAFERVARRFVPLPHRMEYLGDINGVAYINDSKATNLAAMQAALCACRGGVHLIAGGKPKESEYTFVKEILAERVRRIYVIGQASRAMCEAWSKVCPCVECGTLENAFSGAKNAAKMGEIILLSPGCASFDQFRSFEERGSRFCALFEGADSSGDDAL